MQQITGPYMKPVGNGQVVAYTGTAGTITSPLPPSVNAVWVFCTTTAYVKVGASPTATSADIPVAANWPVMIQIDQNNGDQKVSAIQETTGGNLHVQGVAY